MIFNQRGSTILVAMISVFVVGLTVNTMLSEANYTYSLSTNSRARSAFTNLELRLRQRALNSTSYVCPTPNQPNQCDEVPGVFAIRIPVPSARCAVAGCGVVVLPDLTTPPPAPNQFFDPNTLQVRARLVYEGTEKSFPVRSITISIPADILVPTITCPDATPLFMGFANGGPNPGAPICRPIPGIAGCGPGEFLSEVNGSTLGSTCLPLPLIDCPATHVIESMNWVGAGNVTHTCRPRWEPFAYYGFTATIASGAANTQPPLPNPPDNPPPDFQKRTPAPTVNCVGAWGACGPNSGTCGPGAGIQIYAISQPAQFGGSACPFAAGASQLCDLPACGPPPSGGG